jgi:ureidoacrylate peracid hydrolase
VRNTHSEWTTTKSRKEQTAHVGVDYRTRYWEGTPGNDFLEGLNPGPEDLIFIKHSYSPYAHGPMDLILRSRGIQTVLLTGGSTLGAVETVAKDSMVRGYNVVVVDDCVHPRSGAIYEMVIDYVNRHLGITAPSEEIMSCWRGNG